MHQLRNIKWMPVLMTLSILAIAAFQFYWLRKAYEREARTLDMRANILFRETVRALQASKLKLDKFSDSSKPRIFVHENRSGVKVITTPGQKMDALLDVAMKNIKDSVKGTVVYTEHPGDSVHLLKPSPRRDRMIQFLFDLDSLQDSIKVKELDSVYAKRLEDQNLQVPFTISRIPTKDSPKPVYNEVTLGFQHPISYRLDLGNTNSFLLKLISAPIVFSFFLVAFTLLSFTLLYLNLLRQRRLANIKNEFISNITHELKTPIATVSVAIEALRSFNASLSPQKTTEYLNISANELQRLSLLVDKVLKLSMFEKKRSGASI